MRSAEATGAPCAAGAAGADAGTGAGTSTAGFAATGVGADAAGSGFAAGLGAGAGADAAADPTPSITATIVWIGTVCPSGTLISFSTPAEGEGISASTLSVEISNSGSSRSTLSPGFFSHLVMVPSKMLSPIWGMTTSTAIAVISFALSKKLPTRALLACEQLNLCSLQGKPAEQKHRPLQELQGASVAHGSKNRSALKIRAWGGKRGRRERALHRFWKLA